MHVDVKYEAREQQQQMDDEHDENNTNNRSIFGELVFSHEQQRLMAKHIVICMSFLYGLEAAALMALCGFLKVCFTERWLYMIEILVAFTISWNYGVYRGYRSMYNRLLALNRTEELNKTVQELHRDQERLRTFVLNLEHRMRDPVTVPSPVQIQPLLLRQAQGQVGAEDDQPGEQKQQQQQQQELTPIQFQVSPLSNDSDSKQAGIQTQPSTPFNTPLGGNTPVTSPKSSSIKTTPMAIPNTQQQHSGGDEKRAALPFGNDSLTYAPVFEQHTRVPPKVMAVVHEEPSQSQAQLSSHVLSESNAQNAITMQRLLDETEALTMRLQHHINVQQTEQQQQNNINNDDDDDD